MNVVNWWISLEPAQQIFWSVAIVSSILLIILGLFSLFGTDPEGDTSQRPRERRFLSLDPKTVFSFFTFFGWASVLSSYFIQGITGIITLSMVAGILGAFVPGLLAPFFRRGGFDALAAIRSTGEVLKPIPPHRNGFGKVHINLRTAPFEMEAVTAGEELPAGVPVRVVDVIDERVLLVEAIYDTPPDNGQDPSRPPR